MTMIMTRTLQRWVVTFLLVGVVSVGVAGCLLVPVPVWDGGGHHGHGHWHDGR
jgi:hypothetical protein